SGPVASHPDDDVFYYRRPHTNGHRKRGRCSAALRHCGDDHRRANALPAVDADRYAGHVFVIESIEGTETGECAKGVALTRIPLLGALEVAEGPPSPSAKREPDRAKPQEKGEGFKIRIDLRPSPKGRRSDSRDQRGLAH